MQKRDNVIHSDIDWIKALLKRVGFDGGSFLFELGPPTDVLVFFRCVQAFADEAYRQHGRQVIPQRLYGRYLRKNELTIASDEMNCIKTFFSRIVCSTVDWLALEHRSANTELDLAQPTLADVFSRYFDGFEKCVESANVFFETWGIYQPVRIVICDMPDYMTEKKRPLAEYDGNEDAPFWAQDSTIAAPPKE